MARHGREGAAPNPALAHGYEARRRELGRRRLAIAADLRGEGQDAVLFTREGSVAYVCGYTTATWSNFSRPVIGLLGADGALAIVVAETESDAVRERVPDAVVWDYVELRRVEEGMHLPDGRVQFAPHAVDVIRQLLADWGAQRLMVDGLAAAFPPIAQLTTLLPLGSRVLSDASALLWRRRLVKSAWEVERLRDSCAVLEAAFGQFEAELEPGLTEREIHGVLAASAFRAGADALGYTNVVAGVNRGLFGAPTDRRWGRGEVLYVDGGTVVDGYWADFCRMYVVDDATRPQAEGYARALRGLDEAGEAFREGMTAGELAGAIASAADLRPDEVGFGRFGHGIGLYMPEPPSIHPLDDTPLTEGHVVCVEPAVNYGGANYVAEEQCAVTNGQLERLSPPAPRHLIGIG